MITKEIDENPNSYQVKYKAAMVFLPLLSTLCVCCRRKLLNTGWYKNKAMNLTFFNDVTLNTLDARSAR